MNKKIIAFFCVVILMASIFTACGNKGYLLAKDENGNEHAYVTDENGETVLNDNGDIRVYETDKNGKIVKDEDGKPKENSVKKPEYEAKDDKYETNDFVLKIEDGWTNATKGKYIKGENTNCFIEISKYFDDYKNSETSLEERLSDTIELNKNAVNNLKEEYHIASFKHRYEKVGNNDMYILEFYVEDINNKPVLYGMQVYFAVGENVYSVVYGDADGKEYDPNFNFLSYIEKNLTIKEK